MAAEAYDLVVIGGGPGGYVAAIRAAQLGLNTAIVERAELGGICLNWGCIPTKALLRSAEVYHLAQHLDAYGIAAENIRFDAGKIIKRSRDVAARLNAGVTHLLKKNKVSVIAGEAKLTAPDRIVVALADGGKAELSAPHIILATGARARQLPGLETDGRLIWSYREAMVPDEIPASLLIVGSGAIGIEFASFYRTLGAEVTVVEMVDRILPVEDAEISALAAKAFKKQGMQIHTGATVAAMTPRKEAVEVTLRFSDDKEQALTVDRVIMAVGITGNIEGLGLEALGVSVERGHIVTDESCATSVKGIYAIGDVAGPPWLAHKASHEGVLCVEHIVGGGTVHPLDPLNVPGCTYCTPQIASVGLTEAAAEEQGYKIRVGRFPYVGNGKAIAMGDTDGLIKTIFDAKTGELLGAHMIGAEVTELIQGYCVAKTLETTEAELMHTIFPHPTLSEMMHESVLDAYGRALHF